MTMTKIPTGKFVWFDYVAPSKDKAEGFLGELFGWKTQAVPMPGATYTMFTANDEMIGGYMPTPNGAPPDAHWLTHLAIADAHATCDLIAKLGGKVLRKPEPVGDYGTMAVVADPLGGPFALWQAAKPEGSGDFKGKPNTWCWNELLTKDAAKSVAFYTAIGGFSVKATDMPSGT